MERILQVVTYMGRGGIETMLMNYYLKWLTALEGRLHYFMNENI